MSENLLYEDIFLSKINTKDIVVVAPLNWGLGHATRCIPLIISLQKKCTVIIASDGEALQLLKTEFPLLDHYELPSYNITYKYKKPLWNMLVLWPKIVAAVFKERTKALDIVKKTNATVIISDNRLGFKTNSTINYYITHQINILFPNAMISKLLSATHQFFIRSFDYCVVPDFDKKENSLAGRLSHDHTLDKVIYIGKISRISFRLLPKAWDIVVLLSGPEPQRSILEKLILKNLASLHSYKILLIRGTENKSKIENIPSFITTKNLVASPDINTLLNSTKLLISRSGYTTIMDVVDLPIKVIFIPTPGQTEQEYLASFHDKNDKFTNITQNELTKLPKIISQLQL